MRFQSRFGVLILSAIAGIGSLLGAAQDAGVVASADSGGVIAWGSDSRGQSKVPWDAGVGIVDIAAGPHHSLAVTDLGGVVGWGDGSDGQLDVPVSLAGEVSRVAAGLFHSLALRRDGSTLAWGDNSFGQLDIPVEARSHVVSVSAREKYSLAVTEAGDAVAWGDNSFGQLDVPESSRGRVRSVAAGAYHALAVQVDGSVIGWGNNRYGESDVPASASSHVVSVAAGVHFSVALREDGSVVVWGSNIYGQAAVPESARSGVVAVAAGDYHVLALKSDGSVIAWGWDEDGQSTLPVRAREGVRAIAAAGYRSLAIGPAAAVRIDRIAGADRFETSVAVSRSQWSDGEPEVVVVASGEDFPDALSAGPAAASLNAPVLLTGRDRVPEAIVEEIQRLQPDRVVVTGGPAAVSDEVVAYLGRFATRVDRVAGADRFATSRAIADYAFDKAEVAMVATGASFPDALSGGAALQGKGPLLLVDGGAGKAGAETVELLNGLDSKRVSVLGGTAAVSDGVQEDLERSLAAQVDRVSGPTRYETSAAINAGVMSKRAFLATGMNFPDALSGAAVASAIGAPLYVVMPGCVPEAIFTQLATRSLARITLLGGTGALDDHVAALSPCR